MDPCARAIRRAVGVIGTMAFVAACGPSLISVSSSQPTRTTSPVASVDRTPDANRTEASATQPAASPIPENILATPGAILVSKLAPGPPGWWVLKVDVVRQGAPMAEGTFTFRTPDGWAARWDNGSIIGTDRVTSDGWAAIEIEREVEQLDDDNAILVVDLLGRRGATGPIIGSAPVWLPDGTLLVTAQARVDGVLKEVARRVLDHGFGRARDLVIDDECVVPYFPLRYLVREDGSGIDGFDTCRNAEPAVLRWDGSVAAGDPVDPPFLELGGERYAGADGARILPCRGQEEMCPIRWRRADGTVLKHPAQPVELAWTRDGSAVVILDFTKPAPLRGSRVGLITDGAEGLVTTSLGPLRADQPEPGLYFFQGMSPWAAVLESDEGNVNIIPLDGSPVIGPFDGILAGVNP